MMTAQITAMRIHTIHRSLRVLHHRRQVRTQSACAAISSKHFWALGNDKRDSLPRILIRAR